MRLGGLRGLTPSNVGVFIGIAVLIQRLPIRTTESSLVPILSETTLSYCFHYSYTIRTVWRAAAEFWTAVLFKIHSQRRAISPFSPDEYENWTNFREVKFESADSLTPRNHNNMAISELIETAELIKQGAEAVCIHLLVLPEISFNQLMS